MIMHGKRPPPRQQKVWRLAKLPLRERALAGQRARTNKAQLRDLIADTVLCAGPIRSRAEI